MSSMHYNGGPPYDGGPRQYLYMPQVGCFLLLVGLCLLPIAILTVLQESLEKLHLHPAAASAVIVGILVGGFVNLPIYRFERPQVQVLPESFFLGMRGWVPIVQRDTTQTILAVNVGGCVIPLLLVLYELMYLAGGPSRLLVLAGIAAAINIIVCYSIARPMPGVGIAMPAFIPPLFAAVSAWLLLLPTPELIAARAPIAFIAGVSGPLVGADLLHLSKFTKVSVGVLSIGGAGTFDGIVLSGIMAAFLA